MTDDGEASQLTIPWKRVAIISTVVALSSVGVIAVLATVSEAEALSTVALALALVAFSSQLLIFSVQTWQSTAQLRQAEALNRETGRLVADMQARVSGTHEMVSAHHQELLRLAHAKQETEEAKAGRESDGSREAFRRIVAMSPTSTTSHEPDVDRSSSTSAGSLLAAISSTLPDELRRVAEWPDGRQEIVDALEVFEKLSDTALFNYVLGLGDDILSRYHGAAPGLSYQSQDQPAIEAGLLRHGPVRNSTGQRTVQVTEKGREMGRILLSAWPPPDPVIDLADRLWEVRNRSGLAGHSAAEVPPIQS